MLCLLRRGWCGMTFSRRSCRSAVEVSRHWWPVGKVFVAGFGFFARTQTVHYNSMLFFSLLAGLLRIKPVMFWTGFSMFPFILCGGFCKKSFHCMIPNWHFVGLQPKPRFLRRWGLASHFCDRLFAWNCDSVGWILVGVVFGRYDCADQWGERLLLAWMGLGIGVFLCLICNAISIRSLRTQSVVSLFY